MATLADPNGYTLAGFFLGGGDKEVTTTVKPGERFIAVKAWNPPAVTIGFDAEHKVLIQLRISAGMLKTN